MEHGKPGLSAGAITAVVVVVAIIAASGYLILLPISSGSSSPITITGTTTVNIPQGAGSGQNFSPVTLSVAPGTNVTFIDQDSLVPHDVYFTSIPSGASIPGNSDPPILIKGESYSVILTVPGTYDYECQFHATWMIASIIVT
jgi:plastocyanin